MNKGNLTGWRDVFSFTLIQTLKSKAFRISYVIILAVMLFSMPVVRIITSNGKSDANAPSPVKKVYLNNKTALPNMDFQELKQDKKFAHILFENMKEDYDIVANRIQEKEKDSVILTLTDKEGSYSFNLVRASKGSIKEGSLKQLSEAVTHEFDAFKINTLGITSAQLSMINSEVDTKVSMADVSGAEVIEKDTKISNSQYWFIYGLLFIVMMVNVLASSQIATSIVTEKSTRVIEYLLTSVKPLALMVGKILAMLTAVVFQIISIMVVSVISNKLSAIIYSGNGESVLSQYLPKNIFENLNIINILFCLILIVLGMIFYAGLAGLAGATVSRIEEVGEGLMLFTFTNLIGVYIGMGAAVMLMGNGVNAYVIFSFLFPLSSPFLLPGAILIGKASLPIVAGAIVLQVIFIALLFKFVAKVYETLIIHNGNKIKIKELIKISKTV